MGTDAAPRLTVRKTYKLFIGGGFPRSESGRVYPVYAGGAQAGESADLLAHAAQASRKDVRDAVTAARQALPGWAGATAYNRGQVVYRIAELLEGRREQFVAEVSAAEAVSTSQAEPQVAAAVDRLVWYAGWADKYAQVAGSANPVAGPYFCFSQPEPTGVVGVLAPADSSLLGLIGVLAPVIVTGNACVVVAAHRRPLPAVSLAEVLATADLPAGVVNLLTGEPAELAPWLASHRDVDALDLTGADELARPALARAGADSVTRVFVPERQDLDWSADPGLARLGAFVETKTVWHPIGH